MYQITYKKANGEIIQRVRNTLPNYAIGEETSMGWIILNIKYKFNNNYYEFCEYKRISNKYYKFNHFRRKLNLFIKKYAVFILYIPLITIIFLK